jgi:polar amino acid transport system substrate-binding protein
MTDRGKPALAAGLLAGLLAAAGLSGCGAAGSGGTGSETTGSETTGQTVTQVQPAATSTDCKDGQPVTSSVAPGAITTDPGSWPSGSTMQRIRERGSLIVGTSGDAQLWGATNPEGVLTGYDVDLGAAVADALGVDVDYKVLALSDRQAALNRPDTEGGVDLVAERMTITCDRWQGTSAASPAVNFSAPYYLAGQQQLLVRSDNATATGIADFTDQPVCGVTGSSSLAGIQSSAARIVTAPSAGQCLVMFQEGEAVAVTGDDTTLAGLRTQDRLSRVIGPRQANVPYGLGLPPGDQAFTSFVNRVLEGLRSGRGDASLTGLYDRWMKPQAGGSAPATEAVYGRDVAALAQQTG